MLARSLRHRAPVLWLLLPFLAGLVAARILPRPVPIPPIAALALVCVLASLWPLRRPVPWAVSLCLGLFFAGACHYQVTRARMPEWDELPPRQTELCLRVERVFAPKPGSKTISGLASVTEASEAVGEIRGQRVYFSLRPSRGTTLPLRSEELGCVGILESLPPNADTATFAGFLANSGVNFRFTRGRVLRRVREPTAYRQFCDRALHRFSSILNAGLEDRPELSAISRGMLLGEVGELTAEQNALFLQSGTLHLFSVSGLHIAAIAVALHFAFGILRLPRWPKFAVSLAALWLYVDITGASPSAVRAFWMVLLVEAAYALRRPINPVATLGLSALVALVANPFQLFGASFQMSYGIVAGLLLLGLPLAERWQDKTALFSEVPKVTWAWWQHALVWCQRAIAGSLGIGVATGLVGDIAGVLYFQLFTPGALAANLVLIPLSSFALWSGFLSLIAGLAGGIWLSAVFNHAAALILFAIQEAIRLCVAMPGAFVRGQFTTVSLGFGAFAGLVALFLYGYSTRWELRRGGYWPPFAWTALALTVAVRYGAKN
ncbi:competence protein ComEC [Opitutaceae bacterium EW11]|nr:competence protein ComEC [Opitutaceae bacterium EW11]